MITLPSLRIWERTRTFSPIQNTVLFIAGLSMCLLGLLSSPASAEREWGVNRGIKKVSKSVYRFGSDNQYGAYIVGSSGIAVVDGHYCSSGTMDWLKEEIEKRHDVPVRYVILSHDHQDHNCNSQVFSDTAVAVGHKNLLPHLIREKRNSAIPEITFENSMDIILGDVTVNLMFLGSSHSDNLIQVHIPTEKVLIAVDMAKGRSLFPDYRDMDVNSTLKVLKKLANLDDVEIVLPGHGEELLEQQNFGDQYKYLKTLRDEVYRLMADDKSLGEMRKLIKLEEFKDYRGYDKWLDNNIVTMWEYVYRYREPNERITQDEAVWCREDLSKCRTGPIKK